MWILDSLKARKNSSEQAIVNRFESYTFADLWYYSESIARDIDNTGKKSPVVIYGDKHIDIIPTMIAALKTGRAYVPVDVTYPVERLKTIVETVDACVIYNFSDVELDLPFTTRNTEWVRQTLYTQVFDKDIPENQWVQENDDCYILFTSGSTGVPKGVPISKANIVNFANYDLYLDKDVGQFVPLQYSFSFDLSGTLIYYYLFFGKTLLLIDKELQKNTAALIDWLSSFHIAMWSSTPSFLDICRKNISFNATVFSNLKFFYFCGEVLAKNTVSFLFEQFPNGKVYNLYGPTEATMWFGGCEVTHEMVEDSKSIPIGSVMEEADYYLDTGNDLPSSEDNPGELVVVSRSVSRGYFNNPEKTAASFFCADDGRMGYRTGDLVYERDGLLYFVSRKDFQIKLSGYRIEIEDIVSNLNKIDFVENSVVLPEYNMEGKAETLAAFVVLKSDYLEMNRMKTTIQIKKKLRELVPAYMMPHKFIFLEVFPLNVNGKIDRKVLAEMLKK